MYSEDGGFAIAPWTKIRFDMYGVYITDASATVMGHYWFTDLANTETKVECVRIECRSSRMTSPTTRYTFQFVRVANPAGKLKIVLHHSSIPFSP